MNISQETLTKLDELCGIKDLQAYLDSIIDASETQALNEEFDKKPKEEKVTLLKVK